MLIPGCKLVKYFLKTSTSGFHSGMPFYAVARGRRSGVFKTWEECKEQVKGFSGAKYKKFNTMVEAKSFVSGLNDAGSSGYSSSATTDNGSSMMRNKLVPAIATHVPIPPLKRMKVEEEKEDESVVIENKDAFDHLDDVPAVSVQDPDHIIVEDVNFSSQEPEHIFEPRSVFVVIEGRNKGIYRSVTEAWNEIDGYSNSFVKTFKDEDDARFFLENYKANAGSPERSPPLERDGTTRHVHVWTDGPCESNGKARRHVHVWTDGACESNGKARAAAGIGVYWGPNDPRNICEPLLGRQTNNRAEIHAAIRAIREAKSQGYTSVTVHTDSLFLINSITKWVTGWIRRGWTLATGAPVVNKEDFLQLLDVMKGIDVKWEKVPAHSGDEGNEQADRLAREGINKPLVTASSWNSPCYSQTPLRN